MAGAFLESRREGAVACDMESGQLEFMFFPRAEISTPEDKSTVNTDYRNTRYREGEKYMFIITTRLSYNPL